MHENLTKSILKEVEKYPGANNKQDIIIKSISDLGNFIKKGINIKRKHRFQYDPIRMQQNVSARTLKQKDQV